MHPTKAWGPLWRSSLEDDNSSCGGPDKNGVSGNDRISVPMDSQ